jgi:hypothetical protein
MIKLATSSEGSSVSIAEACHDWRPTQGWLAEMTRTVATRMFAQANLEDDESGNEATIAVHRGALTGQVRKIFGALFDESAPHLSVTWIVDLLVHLDDLGDVGYGYYVPRESRVVRLTECWGRIAGGLPLELSEHPEGGIESLQNESVGRVVRMAQDFAPHDQGTEHSEVFRWAAKSVDRLFADLCDGLPERPASPPPEEITLYYNSQDRRVHSRGDRWQNRFPGGAFVVARTGSLPTHYCVHIRGEGQRGAAWFDVSHEKARRWVLLAEKLTGSTNRITAKADGHGVSVLLPDMLPNAWTAALFACASAVVPVEKGWTLGIQNEAMALVKVLLQHANIELI